MIVTEEDLKPYRSPQGLLGIRSNVARWSPVLPANFFGHSLAELDPGWTASAKAPQDLNVVLALAFIQVAPILKPGRRWVALTHQCGNHACEQMSMIATCLTPRPKLAPALKQIAREGFGAETGHFYHGSILASRIARYVGTLETLGLDCEATWPHLTKAVYPIDGTQENLERVAENAPNLDSIADWTGYTRARYNSNLAILVLTENSD